jgi:hypothetical protein
MSLRAAFLSLFFQLDDSFDTMECARARSRLIYISRAFSSFSELSSSDSKIKLYQAGRMTQASSNNFALNYSVVQFFSSIFSLLAFGILAMARTIQSFELLQVCRTFRGLNTGRIDG